MCPKCKEPLIVVEFRGVEVDHCLSCNGTWFDAGELELVIEMAGAAPAAVEAVCGPRAGGTPGKRKCPRCGRKMIVRQAGDPPVEVDVCPGGEGIWLDAGEVATLVQQGGADRAVLADFFGEMFQHELANKRPGG